MDISTFKEESGKRLKLYISSKGLTQKEFAESIGIEPTSISRVVKGNNGISSDLAYSIITKYADLNWNWLLKNEGEMTMGYNAIEDSPNTIESINVNEKTAEYKSLREEVIMLRERVKGLEVQIKLKGDIIDLLKKK